LEILVHQDITFCLSRLTLIVYRIFRLIVTPGMYKKIRGGSLSDVNLNYVEAKKN